MQIKVVTHADTQTKAKTKKADKDNEHHDEGEVLVDLVKQIYNLIKPERSCVLVKHENLAVIIKIYDHMLYV